MNNIAGFGKPLPGRVLLPFDPSWRTVARDRGDAALLGPFGLLVSSMLNGRSIFGFDPGFDPRISPRGSIRGFHPFWSAFHFGKALCSARSERAMDTALRRMLFVFPPTRA